VGGDPKARETKCAKETKWEKEWKWTKDSGRSTA